MNSRPMMMVMVLEQLNNDPLLNKDGKWIACQRNSEIWLSQNYDPATDQA